MTTGSRDDSSGINKPAVTADRDYGNGLYDTEAVADAICETAAAGGVVHRIVRAAAPLAAAAILVLAGSSVVRADIYTDTFETGNSSGWAFIRGGDTIETTGGNPGRWLHQDFYDTFGPSLETFPGGLTPFHGDYRALNVSRIGLDARIDYTDFGSEGFELTLILRNTNGTPFDIADDDYAYYVGPFVPPEGLGWFHYDFAVPSQSNDPVPAGWKGAWLEDCENFRPGVTWSDLMTDIDQVEFWFIDPCLFAIFQRWDVGADNLTIEYNADPAPVGEPALAGVDLRLVVSPSPSNGPVTFEYALPVASGGEIHVFDVAGRVVTRFAVNEASGTVRWDGLDAAGNRVSPGVYLARVQSSGRSASTRIAVVR